MGMSSRFRTFVKDFLNGRYQVVTSYGNVQEVGYKVWKDTITEVSYVKPICSIMMPKGTKIDYNISGNNTFFNVYTPCKFVTLDVSQLNKDTNLEIFTTNNGKHTFYLIGKYEIKCKEFSTFIGVTFYEIYTHKVINSEFITEEL